MVGTSEGKKKKQDLVQQAESKPLEEFSRERFSDINKTGQKDHWLFQPPIAHRA